MFSFLNWLFTWWNGPTVGTAIFTWAKGRFVGEDEQGNRYYEQKTLPKGQKRRRRWVVYKGVAEATRVPPEWHAWLHHIAEEPPTVAPLKRQAWEKDHKPNQTGTPGAYRPGGSVLRPGGERQPAGGDYEAWQPNAKPGTNQRPSNDDGAPADKTGTDR